MSTPESIGTSAPAGLREVREEELTDALEEMLVPRLADLLRQRQSGHCARITDVDSLLAARLTRGLRSALGQAAQVYVLGSPPEVLADVAVSSTKLVELRNPETLDSGDRLRPPLLAFVPPGTHASAEDSFGVATFEQIDLGDVYAELAVRLRDALPTDLRDGASQLFEVLDEASAQDRGRHVADSRDRARFLLSVRHNEFDPAAAGAALFEVGLMPDFTLFEDLERIRGRVAQNVKVAQELADPQQTERQRVLALGLAEPEFRDRLLRVIDTVGLEDPRVLARSIAVDRTNWPMAFQNWPLREQVTVASVRVTVGELALPVAGDQPEHSTDPVLGSIAGQHYLPAGPGGLTKLTVPFEVSPDPRQVPGLERFVARLLAEDGGPTGITSYANVTKTAKSAFKASFSRLDKAGLEAGWHYVRVEPVDSEGIPLPVERAPGDHQQPQESDRFFVLPGGEIDEVPDQRFQKDQGVAHALLRLRLRATAEGRDPADVRLRSTVAKSAVGAGRYSLLASFGGHGAVEVQLSPPLAEHQRAILAAPDLATVSRLEISGDRCGEVKSEPLRWPANSDDELVGLFLQARCAVFSTVVSAAGPLAAGSVLPTVEGTDLLTLRDAARDYAAAYGELIRRQLQRAESADPDQLPELLSALSSLLRLDCLSVELTDPLGTRREATLVPPTHPLRLLWLVTWAELGRSWLGSDTVRQGLDTLAAVEQTLLYDLSALGFPLAVPRFDGRLATAVANLTPFWGVCLPSDTDDPQGILAQLATTLRLPQQWDGESVLSGRSLADRVERYLRLHPYVRTLVVNAVGAGRAEHLADMLIELQRRSQVRDVNYDLRLYAPAGQQDWTGEALAQLLRGEWSSVNAAEVFHVPSADGVTPKLAVAVRPLSALDKPSPEQTAHMTLLFDVFGGEQVDAVPGAADIVAPVHGLVQDIKVEYLESGLDSGWRKTPRHGRPHDLLGAEELTDLLSSLPAAVSAAAAAVATGQVGLGLVPRTTLALDTEDRALLNRAHRISDWVIVVDRTMGVEYFDSPAGDDRPDYVIDYDTDTVGGLGHHLVVSSRSTDELRALLAPVTGQHGLGVEARHTGTFFDQLRLLSGRLAFKLASTSTTQRTEVLGLALARLYLDYQGALTDQILVPLDAHQDLYREAKRRADAVGESIDMQRTDLALFDVDATRRVITCRLVEVKCYSSLDRLTDYQDLRSKMADQIRRSEAVLGDHFGRADSSLIGDRPDRAMKNAQLSSLLRFHLGRAVRHGVMRTPHAAEEAYALLDHLDDGYTWQVTRSALLFDLATTGSESDAEDGVEFHRVGRDLIGELLDAVPTDAILSRESAESASTTLAVLDLSVPRLFDAAFRAQIRDHVKSVDRPSGAVTDQAARPGGVVVATNPGEPRSDRQSAASEEVEVPQSAAVPLPRPDHAVPDKTAAPYATTSISGTTISPAYTPDVYLGVSSPSPQYGVLGDTAGKRVALDLNETHTISLFGVQGGGKSYTLGSVMEMASLSIPPMNELPRPLATVVFHFSQTLDYAPEFTSMAAANDEPTQLRILRDRYGVQPQALSDVVMLVPGAQVTERQAEHPGLEVRPLAFGSAELRAEHWRFLMGAVGNQSTYIRQLGQIMRAHRNNLSLEIIRQGIDTSKLSDHLKSLAQQRLDLAAEYIDDNVRVKDLVRPGRLIIVDLRDEFIEKDEALGLFVVLMQLFAEAQDTQQRFNKLVVFDEAHKYIENPDLVAGLVESVREMRHKGMSVLVASQDPPSVPIALIELSNHIILHKFTSPAWLKHLQKANSALAELTPAKMAALAPGSGYIWSGKATDPQFTRGAVKVNFRPRVTRHGGATKTAVE
ncbi:hypothetical protein OG401_22805 [Kitasatospora purpeofusca]|uniref:methylation-associated defense system ATP-binding protein MAD8 n=1 Tax=Kitasatospora purpeofusca TaxID=67352 RepID=UPI002258065C|nr:hypothetical protein [Kitasatospora purpeofusca]MCX4687096.1 hypothetical protein [Kitasatospora purpeofusca]